MTVSEAERVTHDLLWAFAAKRGEDSTLDAPEYQMVWVDTILDLDYRDARCAAVHWVLTEERLPTVEEIRYRTSTFKSLFEIIGREEGRND